MVVVGGGDRRHRHFKLCVWVCVVYVWEEKKSKVQTIFLSLLQPPAPPPPLTHSGLGTELSSVWSELKHWGGGGRGSFVLSAYWKCTVGFFPVWETVYAKLSPNAPIFISSG